MAHDPEMKLLRRLFERIGKEAITEIGLSTAEQRLDSTLIASNIFTRYRVELFRKTLLHFLDWLSAEHPEKLSRLSRITQRWCEEAKETGWFGTVDKDKAKQPANALAQRLYAVVSTLGEDASVTRDLGGGDPGNVPSQVNLKWLRSDDSPFSCPAVHD